MFSTLLGVGGGGGATIVKTEILDTKFIVHPVGSSANRWGIVMLHLYCDVTTKTPQVHVFMYEQLIDADYRELMIAVWKGTMKHQSEERKVV
ncbi:hypothetical protein F442_08927 [Phytophthora nicotianae P10297]|uniref:Uncharacterized protein n=1 Tax=Phytophthora nicotianae P10297 TaxID=1317064 RepID=W2ZBN0_PHYNI|nr:hypothetical protein F442_08927 [Phytophthora nicotianae P10297]